MKNTTYRVFAKLQSGKVCMCEYETSEEAIKEARSKYRKVSRRSYGQPMFTDIVIKTFDKGLNAYLPGKLVW